MEKKEGSQTLTAMKILEIGVCVLIVVVFTLAMIDRYVWKENGEIRAEGPFRWVEGLIKKLGYKN